MDAVFLSVEEFGLTNSCFLGYATATHSINTLISTPSMQLWPSLGRYSISSVVIIPPSTTTMAKNKCEAPSQTHSIIPHFEFCFLPNHLHPIVFTQFHNPKYLYASLHAVPLGKLYRAASTFHLSLILGFCIHTKLACVITLNLYFSLQCTVPVNILTCLIPNLIDCERT